MSRRSARDTAFRLFYEYSVNGTFNPETKDEMRDCFDKGMNENAWEYVNKAILTFECNKDKIDDIIQKNSKRWNISHMARVEVSILRLGVCEMCYMDDIHIKITINECVELAKKYGSDKTPKFINGVLAAVVCELEEKSDEGE